LGRSAAWATFGAHFPFADDEFAFRDRLGRDLTNDDGHRAAELCAPNVLARIHRHVGLERASGLGRIEAYMQTVDG